MSKKGGKYFFKIFINFSGTQLHSIKSYPKRIFYKKVSRRSNGLVPEVQNSGPNDPIWTNGPPPLVGNSLEKKNELYSALILAIICFCIDK